MLPETEARARYLHTSLEVISIELRKFAPTPLMTSLVACACEDAKRLMGELGGELRPNGRSVRPTMPRLGDNVIPFAPRSLR